MKAGNELNFRGGHQQLHECGVHRSDSGLGAVIWCTLSGQFSAQCLRLARSVQIWIWSTSPEPFGAQSFCSSLHTVSVLQCAQIVQLWRIYRVCSAIYTWGASSAADSDAAGKDYGCAQKIFWKITFWGTRCSSQKSIQIIHTIKSFSTLQSIFKVS